jgi:hypothetical protein
MKKIILFLTLSIVTNAFGSWGANVINESDGPVKVTIKGIALKKPVEQVVPAGQTVLVKLPGLVCMKEVTFESLGGKSKGLTLGYGYDGLSGCRKGTFYVGSSNKEGNFWFVQQYAKSLYLIRSVKSRKTGKIISPS